MNVIAAVDLNWGIGYKGNLLQRIPEDMEFFRQMTLGKVVVMGRETFESLPEKKPLEGRINIVLSRNRDFKSDSIIVCHSLEELFHELKKYDSNDVFIIGGESVYSQLLPYCTEAYITKIEIIYDADKFFINIDKEKSWKLVYSSDLKEYNGIRFSFHKYIKSNN